MRRARSVANRRRWSNGASARRAAHPVCAAHFARGCPEEDRQGTDARAVSEPARRAAARPRSDVGGLMRRFDAMKTVYDELTKDRRVIVTIMGAVAAELQSIGHRPNFFYLQHAGGGAAAGGRGGA